MFRGVPLEVWVGNDALPLKTAHLTRLVFLLRNTVRNQAPVCTSTGRGQWEGLRCLL